MKGVNRVLYDLTPKPVGTIEMCIRDRKKDSARAGMRLMVKKLLRKYKYPPEGLEDAVKTVIAQCEMWTDEM